MQFTRKDIEQPEGASPGQGGVCFDPDNVALEGIYGDELSVYRARRIWATTLESHFLLESEHDFVLAVKSGGHQFVLRCEFLTACARYAFWRLTNNQAPEAQYIIETAHIPSGESQYDKFIRAPDLRPMEDGPLVLTGMGRDLRINSGWFEKVRILIERMVQTNRSDDKSRK